MLNAEIENIFTKFRRQADSSLMSYALIVLRVRDAFLPRFVVTGAIRYGVLLCAWLFAGILQVQAQEQVPIPALKPPALMLANVYHPGIDLSLYWVSEKYDGMRAFWNGKHLMTRSGQVIHAPAWFTANWSSAPMDGELWAGRGNFAQTVSTARSQTPDDAAWHTLRFMVFDLPEHGGTFDQRLLALRQTVDAIGKKWVQAVPQQKIVHHAALRKYLKEISQAGAEGLMLHRGDSYYKTGRTDDLLKFKLHDDAEARIIAHLPGKGRHQGRLGALLVETEEGVRFRLGSGFTDEERKNPPSIGSIVTYRHQGTHASGIPRFARFLRVRQGMD